MENHLIIPVFVYSKDYQAVALNLDQAMEQKPEKHGWTHTATLDGALFINYLLSITDAELINEMKALKGEKELI